MAWKAEISLVVLMLVGGARGADEISNALVFPQIVQGVLGPARVRTELLILNPGLVTAQVQLSATSLTFQDTTFTLPPGESRVVVFAGTAPEVGWVRMSATRPVVAHARVVARTGADEAVVSELSYAGVVRASKWVIPIYDLEPDADVALAIAVSQVGPVRLSLWSPNGELVAQRDVQVTFAATHPTLFVRQFFPETGTKRFAGRLVVQALPDVALAYSVLAVQVSDESWTSVPTSAVDIPGTYLMTLGPGGDASVLAKQYGFEVVEFLPLSQLYVVRMTHDIARAVSRDARVGYLQINATGGEA